ncbi:PAS-domain containing protein [Szabonella alba]|uniref:histidine kinase n=1 Tax=Szabonella alba TaxID=2804194 RepID=A0A8K0XZH9_9RHOB|nr:PAS-domain containing protein [Szabonella alba]MBL4915812.1 PAS-domain containing protein [Szabonella alba]
MELTEGMRASLTAAGLNLIQQALSIFDNDLQLALCNRRYQDMFGLPDWLTHTGVSFEETIRYLVQQGEYGPVGNEAEAVRARVETARAFQPHYMERRRANGRWISVEGAPLPQGGWVTVYTDITEIKMQEGLLRARSEELSEQVLANAERLAQANRELAATNAALQEAKRELTEMEARTRLTTEMMPAHIAHVGRDLRYTYSNRRLSSVMPGRPNSILGLTGREALGQATFEKIAPYLDRALAGEASVFEFADDESGRRIRAAFTPDRLPQAPPHGTDGNGAKGGMSEAAGPINGVYILSMDVTEEVQARSALMQTRKRELAAQVTSGLAHDFSNLLTIILGLQSRLQRMALPLGGADLVAATLGAARRGGTLLDRIAGISGRRELRPSAVDLRDFLADLVVLARPVLPDSQVLEVQDTEIDTALMLDAGALQDALVNLILNARDAMAGRQGCIRLTARALRDTWLEIAVEDDGPGFAPEALERGLEPFFTTKGGEGSGLGLSMVYDQVTLAGGTVRLANRAGGGARVILRLPLRRAVPGSAPRLVLVVEDSADIRETVREMLRALGHSVIEAGSAEEGLQLADLPGIDVILSDISLAGPMNGVEMLEVLAARAHPARVCLMSALPPGTALRDRGAARFGVLQKPFDTRMLDHFLTGGPA